MESVALAEIPGIGPKLQDALRRLGLVQVKDVLPHDLATLTRWGGASTAAWLHARVRGVSHATVEARTAAKQVSREETFDRDIGDSANLASELRHLAAKVAADLRSDGLAARTLTVKLRTNDFATRTASRTLPAPVESDRAVENVAIALLTKLRSGAARPARLVGVAASNLSVARDGEQMMIFAAAPGGSPETVGIESERDRELSRAVDRVRERFGENAIRAGAPRNRVIGEKGARNPRHKRGRDADG